MTHPPGIVYAATAADRAMVVPVMALIQSLAVQSPNTVLGVISVGLTAAEETLLAQFAAGVGLDIHLIPFDVNLVKHTVLRASHLSRAAYARLFLPELLPNLDRVIWLDTDVLVLEDLSALWRVDLNGALVAAVPDDFIDPLEIAATNSRRGEYFNSGVMVLNLALWRAENLMPRITALMSSPHLICEDQSVLNTICADRVQIIDHKWNFHASRFLQYPAHHRRIAPAILHYCGSKKPWIEQMAFGNFYLQWLPRDTRAKQRSAFGQRFDLRRIERMRRYIFGVLMGRQKYWRALELNRAEGRLFWRFFVKLRRLG